MRSCRIFFFTILLIGRSIVASVQPDQKKVERMELVNADECSGDKDVVRTCAGNVQFRQGDAVMLCDRAVQYVQEGRVVFEDHVLMVDKGKELRADRITYHEHTKIAFAERNVRFQDSTKTLSASRVRYFDEEERVVAEGQVVITEIKQRFRLEGQKAEYFRKSGYAKVTGQPVLTQLDSLQQPEIIIHGRSMEMFNDGDSLKVVEDVKVTREDVVAHCGELTFLQNDDKILLCKSPSADMKNTHLRGQVLELMLQKNEIKGIHIVKEAVAISKNDSTPGFKIPYDILTGEDILVQIEEDQIDSVTVTGRATSYYHVIDKGEEQGLNKVIGDRLMLSFQDGDLKKVKVSSSPSSSSGVFYPSKSQSAVVTEMKEILKKNGVAIEDKSVSAAQAPEINEKLKKE